MKKTNPRPFSRLWAAVKNLIVPQRVKFIRR